MSELDIRAVLYFGEGGPQAPEGPGWYLAATYNAAQGKHKEVIPHVRLLPKEAILFAKMVDKLSRGKPLNWYEGDEFEVDDRSLEAVVTVANDQAAAKVTARLAEAESLVRNLEALKARAKEFESINKAEDS